MFIFYNYTLKVSINIPTLSTQGILFQGKVIKGSSVSQMLIQKRIRFSDLFAKRFCNILFKNINIKNIHLFYA